MSILGKNKRKKAKTKKSPSGQVQTCKCEDQDAIGRNSISSKSGESDGEWKGSSALSATGSSDDFESVASDTSDKPKGRRKAKLLLFSEFKPKRVRIKRSKPTREVTEEQPLDDSDDGDWEEVDEKVVKEVDFVQALLDSKKQATSEDCGDTESGFMSVTVPLGGPPKRKKDPKLLAELERMRRLKEDCAAMHLVHVLCFLTYSRRLNQICDSPIYRAMGLSLLDKVGSIWSKDKLLLDKSKWQVDHVAACLIFISSYCSTASSAGSTTLVQRVAEGRASTRDHFLLLVSALRALDFDVRLVSGIIPIPLLPQVTPARTDKSKQAEPKIRTKGRNRKIISSSSDSEAEETIPRRQMKSCVAPQPCLHLSAEIYLPSLGRWVQFDSSMSADSIDNVSPCQSLLYVVGMTTSNSASLETRPYVGRNPVDLAARYDPDWCVDSRRFRLPAERWSNLLSIQRHFFDLDAVATRSLLPRSNDLPTLQRDLEDERRILSELSTKPLPKRVQDFKNHPLYALQRHLLKFEVIYPPDATPAGFFHNEPVYPRECVHLCHTRESWLKEAKVVRPFEQPAKVVKARMSLKRKLLQGSDDQEAMVNVYGSWQVEDYQPPEAKDGVVPRNEHGTVDMFKPCMLPVGCAHLCLTGIQHIAKRLGIDCAPAISGWTFHGAGWAVPIIDGYIVCKEAAPALVDAWHAEKMNAAKAEAQERSERALENWRKFVRGLLIWHRVKAQYALAPLQKKLASVPEASTTKQKGRKKKISQEAADVNVSLAQTGSSVQIAEPISFVCRTATDGWQRLGDVEEIGHLPLFPQEKPPRQTKRPTATQVRRTKKKRGKKAETSSSEESEDLPYMDETDADDITEEEAEEDQESD
ncbi:unnamed protein product [Calicophoron daubneyi]|uniref:Uncharacterized protein n=1 Tax=Calicophoron daubneyi TaxID=300641 RepID=A0AAV2TFD8_CALDB